MRPRSTLFLAAILLLLPLATIAIRFPDVPSNYPHADAVEELTDLGVIGGNPDGTFRPHDPVNRAAMLAMLYRAAKITPERAGGCFEDVEETSWYEFTVCDATAKGYVKGYVAADGKRSFKPGQPVTRAEAIKLTIAVFNIAEADLTATVKMYRDIAPADWHVRYIHTALALKILPIEGQDGDTFRPNQILERGEAAAYIWNAIPIKRAAQFAAASSAASSVTPAAADAIAAGLTEIERRAAAALRTIQQEQRALERAQANTQSVTVPFSDKRNFDGKIPFSYEFSIIDSVVVVDVLASITEWNNGSLTCRLYHLGRSGFSQEYYLGFQDGKNCMIRAALSPGSWRLQLEPEKLAPAFTVSVKQTKGDGNDGFSQAGVLPLGQARSDSLDTADLEDWFKFTIPKDTKTVDDGGREMLMRISSTDTLGCLIYPLDDVDQFGFKGPECGLRYLYPPGTYMVSVRHGMPLSAKQTYSIQIK